MAGEVPKILGLRQERIRREEGERIERVKARDAERAAELAAAAKAAPAKKKSADGTSGGS